MDALFLATAALAAHQHHRRQDGVITTDSTPGLDSTITVDGADSTGADVTLQIVSAKLSGSGCPQGSAVAEISQQLQSVSVVLPASFRAEKGGNAEQKDATKNCLLQIQVLYPAGQRFTVVPADFAGSVRVDAGVSAVLMASMYFASDPEKMVGPWWSTLFDSVANEWQFETRKEFSGDAYAAGTDILVPSDELRSPTLWSKCGSDDTAVLNYRLALTGSGNGHISGVGERQYFIQFEDC